MSGTFMFQQNQFFLSVLVKGGNFDNYKVTTFRWNLTIIPKAVLESQKAVNHGQCSLDIQQIFGISKIFSLSGRQAKQITGIIDFCPECLLLCYLIFFTFTVTIFLSLSWSQ